MGAFFRSFVLVVVWIRKALWLVDEKIAERRAKRAASKASDPTGLPSGDLLAPDPVAALRERAEQHAAEIGPRPRDPHEEAAWEEEWRGAAVLLAVLGEWDHGRLRLAATSESGAARQMLLDAADECAETDSVPEP